MVKVEANEGRIDIIAIDGRTYQIIAELCGIVRAVCTACWEDEENGKEMTEAMISLVVKTLKEVKPEWMKKNENNHF